MHSGTSGARTERWQVVVVGMGDPVQAQAMVRLLARGVLALHREIAGGGIASGGPEMPADLRRASALLSAQCLAAGVHDLGASVHDLLARCRMPFAAWGLPQLRPPFPYADCILLDDGTMQPTPDCKELADVAGEDDAREDIHHSRLRDRLAALSEREAARTYVAYRRFVVEHPLVDSSALNTYVLDEGLERVFDLLAGCYRPLPGWAIWRDGQVRRCATCGCPLEEQADRGAWPDGRCRLVACRAKGQSVTADVFRPTAATLLARSEILAYWVSPGLDEIGLWRQLRQAGLQVELYPAADAADVGFCDLSVGIDVKDYASPLVLGARLSRSIGRFAIFRLRLLAIPDAALVRNRDYLTQLRQAYSGPELIFCRVSEVLGLLGGRP